MRKIGIITIPDYNNYGNRLQNYAVKRYFENRGFEVDTLEMNDKGFSQRKARKIKLYLKKYHLTFIAFVFEMLSKGRLTALRYLKFEKFTRKYLNCRYVPKWEDEVLSKIGREYDYIVLGSDQIWHPHVNTTPYLFFAQFTENEKRRFFSPSFGVETLSKDYAELVRNNLKGIKKISIREEAGKEILEKMTDASITVLCDPTLLLSQEEWSRIAKRPKQIPDEYILSYFLGPISPKYDEVSKKIKQLIQCDWYRIADKKSRESFITGPSEFVYAIKNASFVITDSFHAVVFSLIFGKPFLVCSRLNENGEPAGLDSRIDLLLSMFGMEERKYSEGMDIKKLQDPLRDCTSILHEQKAKVDRYFNDI